MEGMDERSSLHTAHVPLETVLGGITDPVIITDETHEIIDVNRAAGELFDCRPEALLGRSWTDCCPPEDRDAFEDIAERIPEERIDRFDTGDPIRIETFAEERKPVELTLQRIFDGNDPLLFCLCREISERIEREQTLRATIARLEALFEASPVPMAVLDEAGTVERWNHAAEATFGWRPAEVTGKQYPLFTDEGERERVLERLLDGERIAGRETTHQGRDGSLVDVELYAQPLREGGDIASIIVSAINVTALKQREQHLSVLHRIMRHSLRNKVNVIYAVAEHFWNEDDEYTDRLVGATKELLSLTEQAERINQDLHRVENPVPVALDALFKALDEQIQSEYPRSDLCFDDTLSTVPVPDIARRIFEELVGHAIQNSEHTAPRVEVTVSVDRRIVVSLRDDRTGLTPGEKAFIQRDEPAALLHGSRLGLAHADILVTELGGQLSAWEHDEGTTVRVELPRADGSPI